ncbi:hypothetical protein [Chitinophaga solisilvae]|uniref:hypothetical protein n=1 Tax=Chitinophaga solisilvae TaxID=1233460 RepID=UPI001370C0BC|nr:hypothetical protein [Chitinophaga solisilvae]
MKKSLIAAVVVMSISAASFAQAPAAKPAKKEKAKTEAKAPAADSTKKAAAPKKAEKPAAKKA